MLEKPTLTITNDDSFPNFDIPIIDSEGFTKFFDACITGDMSGKGHNFRFNLFQ